MGAVHAPGRNPRNSVGAGGGARGAGMLPARSSTLLSQLAPPLIEKVGPAWKTLQALAAPGMAAYAAGASSRVIHQKRGITAAHLAAQARLSRPTVERHLKRLRTAGLLRTERLAHGLVIDFAPSPSKLFLPPNPTPPAPNPLCFQPRHAAIPPGSSKAAPAPQGAMPGVANATREVLILEHQALVRRVARHCSKSLPYWLEEDDLVSAGQLGLIEAADKYDPARGIPFAGFAYLLIRGRIIDANRRRNYDWELHDTLDAPYADGAASPGEVEAALNLDQTREAIERALAYLDPREQLACRSYLDESQTLRSLGDQLGVTESGACLIRNKARGRLREELEAEGLKPCDASLSA